MTITTMTITIITGGRYAGQDVRDISTYGFLVVNGIVVCFVVKYVVCFVVKFVVCFVVNGNITVCCLFC